MNKEIIFIDLDGLIGVGVEGERILSFGRDRVV